MEYTVDKFLHSVIIANLAKLTIMVNTINRSLYEGNPPKKGESHDIDGGPLYSKDKMLAILNKGEDAVKPVTKQCLSDMRKFLHDNNTIEEILRSCMELGTYRNSVWCQGKGVTWFACDAYLVKREEWNQYSHKYWIVDYYLKFAIGNTGTLIFMVSCHPPRE